VSDVLSEIVASTRSGVERRKAAVPQAELARAAAERRSAGDTVRSFRAALTGDGLSVIAEHKRRSPSAGVIREGIELQDVVRAYERAGAAAVSVLTEETRFGGSLDDLEAARTACSLPLLRKDFVVDSYQVHEALAAGADAVLLIVAALEIEQLAELVELAGLLELGALVEAHSEAEVGSAVEAGATIIGINNRDLATLAVDVETTFRLRPGIPDGVVTVAESGFTRRDELERLAAAGVDAVLVGEALMRAPEIEAACRELTGV
jgi:indole-3-glycerol phosphate synthase